MSDQTPSVPPSKVEDGLQMSDFIVAERIKLLLNGREKAEQERILRWVTESLGFMVKNDPLLPQVTPPPEAGVSHILPSGGARTGHPKNIRTFVAEKKPKNDVQFAAVVAYYFAFEVQASDRKESVTSTDLLEATRLANWSRFQKPTVQLNNAVAQGYLDRAGRGQFRLSPVGENLVAMALPGSPSDTKGVENYRRRKKPKKPKVKQSTKSAKS